MRFQQNGCPAHFARTITTFLDRRFEVGMTVQEYKNGLRNSPDLTTLDFYLWGKLKQYVYSEVSISKEDMKERIRRACSTIDINEIQNAIFFITNRFMHRCPRSSF
jgi:hypothetical protein